MCRSTEVLGAFSECEIWEIGNMLLKCVVINVSGTFGARLFAGEGVFCF